MEFKKSKQIFRAPKEMEDILPKDQIWWEKIWEAGREVGSLYDFSLIETPLLESAELFETSLGAASDIIEKQLFVFKNKGGQRLALRPEATASVCRAYSEHRLGYTAHPLKVYYCGQMFRYEQSQTGRWRQFHQLGFEVLADNHPVYDAQIILAVHRFLNLLKIKDVNFRVNSIGCRICRANYRRKLFDYYRPRNKELCFDCRRKLEVNPLRLLDCKAENCRKMRAAAPVIFNFLCQSCNNYFQKVLEFIEDNNLPYVADPFLVRGLDYYNRTVFEMEPPEGGLALAAGGRYDYLMEIIGGQNLSGVGGAVGLERVVELMKRQKLAPDLKFRYIVFFAAVGEQAEKAALVLMENLRRAGIAVSESLGRKSLKTQLRIADRRKIPLVLILGQKEIFEETIIVRDMNAGTQETVLSGRLVEDLKKRLHCNKIQS